MSYTIFRYTRIRLLAEFKRVRSTKINYTSKILKTNVTLYNLSYDSPNPHFKAKRLL